MTEAIPAFHQRQTVHAEELVAEQRQHLKTGICPSQKHRKWTYWRSALSLTQQLLHHGFFIELCTPLHVDPAVLKESRFDAQCWNVTKPNGGFFFEIVRVLT